MIKFIVPFIALAVVFASCSTEVELNAPYQKTTIVYGLLDPKADTQWVKINKTFLGDGNNLDFATIRDSSEYDFSEFEYLHVQQIDETGNLLNTFNLDSITIQNKDINGIFYAPEQTVYYFVSPGGLNQESNYKLDAQFTDGRNVNASTALVEPQLIQTIPAQNSTATLVLGQQTTNGIQYKTATFKWVPVVSAPFYELTFRFNFTERVYSDIEHTMLVSEEEKFVDFFVGSYGEDDIASNGYINGEISGESFFSFLGNTLEKNPYIGRQIGYFDQSGTDDRTRCFDVILSMGGDELYTYYLVNSPVTGIIQERPSYTNINNGLGLFSSRSQIEITGINLVNSAGQPNQGNLYCLANSPYTIDLNFCDPNPSSDYSCE